MATDYTVIQPVRQRFGDNASGRIDSSKRDYDELPSEIEAPFVGLEKDFPFKTPSVDRGEWAILQFDTLGIGGTDVIQVNGVDVSGGMSPGPYLPFFDPKLPVWSSHLLLVEGSVLAEDNVLHIASGAGQDGNHDDFIVDNVVIWFKTTPADRPVVRPTRTM